MEFVSPAKLHPMILQKGASAPDFELGPCRTGNLNLLILAATV